MTTLVTPRQLADSQPALTLGGVRWDIFNREKNGLSASGALVKRGNRWLIIPEKYLGWMLKADHNDAA
ncbi:MAG: hypothetical protein K1566_16880 [Candidatus Thiodiazotropha sp. (ex. Lucinisca nassula)]|nr:hypothetical protein [Candidatus Thiodiazotropha sp. (ex. Lucinisca nassula)]MCG7869133.1 hypothetical protein [Candidatus Thiodiazotropha taylori]MCG7927264.1 hypothetical protein [Candidatus Thiodiazotropha taylori]MCG7973350.1 hypothetical protein [Candidatus Thiodiazotropha taylori]